MKQICYPGPEAMLQMAWDSQLQDLTEATRLALSLHSRADVVRLALHMVPGIIFDSVSSDVLGQEAERLLQGDGDSEHSTAVSERAAVSKSVRVTLLDHIEPGVDVAQTQVRVGEQDIARSGLAAQLCGLETDAFAYRATMLLARMEAESPGYRNQISSSHAHEDLAGRQVLGLTDIQPWGEQDYRDYGLPDED